MAVNMDFFEVLNKRRSIRSFKLAEIDVDKLNKIIDAIISAPSAGNLQSFKVYIIKHNKIKAQIASACYDQEFISDASIVMVFCADKERSAKVYGVRGEHLYALQDATIAAAYCQLAAAALGLATCWVGAFDEVKIRKILGYGPKLEAIAIMPIGIGAEMPSAPPRRLPSELFYHI